MEWIAGLDFEKIANAIIILLTGFLAAFGFRRGKGSSGPEPAAAPHVEVAAALVDSSAVKLLAGEMAGQTLAVTAQTAALREHGEAIEAHGREMADLKEELRELRGEMRARR